MKSNNKKKSSSSVSVVTIAWLFIASWIVVLLFVWYSGVLHTSKNSTLLYVDKVLNKTEYNLRKAEGILIEDFKHIHVPRIVEIEKEISILDFSPDVETYASKLHQLNYNTGQKYEIHIIFSTDCSTYQDWESLLIFYTATIVKQQGPITRIASGCDEVKKIELTHLYRRLYPHYHIHFTPDFKKDQKSQKSYDFYNKPWGLKHWLENANPAVQDDCVIALIDPDFIFLCPLTIQVRNHPTNLYDPEIESELFDQIIEGRPVGQTYGLGMLKK